MTENSVFSFLFRLNISVQFQATSTPRTTPFSSLFRFHLGLHFNLVFDNIFQHHIAAQNTNLL